MMGLGDIILTSSLIYDHFTVFLLRWDLFIQIKALHDIQIIYKYLLTELLKF